MRNKANNQRVASTFGPRELDFLLQFSRTLSVDLPIRSLLEIVLKQLIFIMEIDETTLTFFSPTIGLTSLGTRRRAPSPLQNAIAELLIITKQPLAISDTTKPWHSKGEIKAKESTPRALLALPLSTHEQIYGILYVYKKEPRPFEYSQFIFYSWVASRLANFLENRQLIAELTRKEQQLAAIIEKSGEGIAVLDEDRKILIWNAALEQMTGIPSERAIGKSCALLHPLLSTDLCPLEIKGSYGEFAFHVGGNRQHVDVIASTVEVGEAKANRVFLFHDVSAGKALDEAKNDFVSLATHQLRTPLTVIAGYLSMIQSEKSKLSPDESRYLQRIQEAANRLSSLVEDLLHVLRLEEGRLAIATGPVEVWELIKEILPDFMNAARGKGLALTISGRDPLTVTADPKWVKHALANVIDNAIKYTRSGGTINITWEKTSNGERKYGVIHVRDTGIGIPPEGQRTLFQKFGRLSSNPVDVSGSGLGLYIAKQLVEKQGGTIEVKSIHGKGSTFSLAFPLAGLPARRKRIRRKL